MPSVNTMFGGGTTAPHSEYAQTPSVPESGHLGVGASISGVDGTPLRVVTIMALMVLGLAGLKWSGYRFNVTSG